MNETALPNARPSAAHQWVAGCTGAPKLRAMYPRESGGAAKEGNRLHDVGADLLVGVEAWGSVGTDDRPLLKHYVEDVAAEVAKAPASSQLLVETHLKWAKDLRLQGTPDAVLVNFEAKRVIIWDLKTGWLPVEAEGNVQLLCYALMLWSPGWTYELRICQNRSHHPDGPVRSWKPSDVTLTSWFNAIRSKFSEAMSPIRARVMTGAHCRYCEALHACPAARTMTLHAADWADTTPADLTPEQLARELQIMRDTKSIVEKREAALEQTIKARLKAGVAVPYVQYVPGRAGARKWLDEDKAFDALFFQTPEGKSPTVTKIRTPTQLIDDGFDEALIQTLTQRQPTKTNLEVDLTGAIAKKLLGSKAPDLSHAKGIQSHE